MIYKSYILEQNLNSIKDCKFFLFYGENIGLKKEFKKKIKQQYSKVDFINLFQDDILKNKEILINEVANKSLFKENKIIFIQQANDKILEILENVSEKLDNERIFIFSDVLDKRSKLRSFFEKNKSFGLTACYNDNEITIRKIITSSLKDFKNLSTEIVNLIIQNTNLDRNKVNNELEKIKSCFLDKKLEFTKIEELLNIKTNEDFNNLKDEALNGNKIKTNKLLADTVFEIENNIFYLNLLNQRLNKLNEINNIKRGNNSLEEAISNVKPPIFWKDKPMVISQIKKWNNLKIRKALNRTYETELKIKSDNIIKKDLLMKKLLIDLCLEASSS